MIRLSGFAPAPIPGPSALPWVGSHANLVRFLADPIGRLTALQRDYGDIVAIAGGNPALVCGFGARCNREVLSNAALFENDDEFLLKTPPGSAVEKLKHALSFQTGERHKRHRRLVMPAFQRSAIDRYATDIVAVTDAALATWPVGQTADVAALTRDLVQRIAVKCLLGLDPGRGDRGLGRLASETMDRLASPLAILFPVRVPGTPYARLLAFSEQLADGLRALIAEKRAQPTADRDALALMLGAREQDGSMLTEDELIGEVAILFVAGHDTQAATLAWTLFLLEQHPAVLADVVDEIDEVLRGDLPTLEAMPRLVLLDRVLKESLRMLPAVPVLFLRVCQAEAQLGPYTLPRGASVLLSPFVTHRAPESYAAPARFDPRRWETITPTLHEYLPFGAGPRMCIGVGFAALATRLALSMILQRYRLSLRRGARVSSVMRGNILAPRHGLPMLVARQDRRFARCDHVRGNIRRIVELA